MTEDGSLGPDDMNMDVLQRDREDSIFVRPSTMETSSSGRRQPLALLRDPRGGHHRGGRRLPAAELIAIAPREDASRPDDELLHDGDGTVRRGYPHRQGVAAIPLQPVVMSVGGGGPLRPPVRISVSSGP